MLFQYYLLSTDRSVSCFTHLYLLLLHLWIESQQRHELGCQVLFLTCFLFFSSLPPWSQSKINSECSHSKQCKKSVILFSCWSHDTISSSKERVGSSLSNDATVPKQINLLWKFQEPAAPSSEGRSFVYRVVLLPDWCTNRGSANANWHLSYLAKKRKKNPLWRFLMRKAAILIRCPCCIAF